MIGLALAKCIQACGMQGKELADCILKMLGIN